MCPGFFDSDHRRCTRRPTIDFFRASGLTVREPLRFNGGSSNIRSGGHSGTTSLDGSPNDVVWIERVEFVFDVYGRVLLGSGGCFREDSDAIEIRESDESSRVFVVVEMFDVEGRPLRLIEQMVYFGLTFFD